MTGTDTPVIRALRRACTLQDRVAELVAKHGSVRAAGLFIGLESSYLHRLGSGEKLNPSDLVLRRLGLRKIVTYELLRKNSR